jgi:plasmid stabilization system protein ParE
MRIVFRPEARAESIEALDWYEARAPGLGFEFIKSLDVALAAATTHSRAFAVVAGDLRRVVLRKFPYSLIFCAENERLVVFAVVHHRRRPPLPQTGRSGAP